MFTEQEISWLVGRLGVHLQWAVAGNWNEEVAITKYFLGVFRAGRTTTRRTFRLTHCATRALVHKVEHFDSDLDYAITRNLNHISWGPS